MYQELLSCPFCGNPAKMDSNVSFFVYCKSCCSGTQLYRTREEAAEIWNKRACDTDGDMKKIRAELKAREEELAFCQRKLQEWAAPSVAENTDSPEEKMFYWDPYD